MKKLEKPKEYISSIKNIHFTPFFTTGELCHIKRKHQRLVRAILFAILLTRIYAQDQLIFS